jgi:hypothetical protein
MSNRRDYILDLLAGVALDGNKELAEAILVLLEAESVLHLGYGDAEIDGVIDKFTLCFGTTKTTKYDRYAAHRLVAKYSGHAVAGIIELLASRSKERYAPLVNNITQLEEKWVSVLAFLREDNKREDSTIQL